MKRTEVMNPLVLAWVGDAVYSSLVRTRLALESDCKVDRLQQKSTEYVSARAQSHFVKALLPLFSEEEAAYYRRGRNAHAGHLPKSASVAEYQAATGLECVFGFLHLTGQQARIEELMSVINNPINNY